MGDRASVPSQNLTFLTLVVVYLTKPNGRVPTLNGLIAKCNALCIVPAQPRNVPFVTEPWWDSASIA